MPRLHAHPRNNRQEQMTAQVISHTTPGLDLESSPTAADRNLGDLVAGSRADVDIEAPTISQAECNIHTRRSNSGAESCCLASAEVLSGPMIDGSNVVDAEQSTIGARNWRLVRQSN